MMTSEIIVAVLSLAGTFLGTFSGTKLMSYRIEQLEKRVEKHNSVVERTYKLEQDYAVVNEQIKVANHRIDNLEKLDKN